MQGFLEFSNACQVDAVRKQILPGIHRIHCKSLAICFDGIIVSLQFSQDTSLGKLCIKIGRIILQSQVDEAQCILVKILIGIFQCLGVQGLVLF